MRKTAIVTDSTAYLSKEECVQLSIHTIPLSVVFGNDSYQEGVDLTTETFYKKMEDTSLELPTTSQPAIGSFVDLFETLRNEGYEEIVSIHLSAKISGTFQTVVSAGEMVDGIQVYAFDSKISCAPQGFFVREAAKLAHEQEGGETIVHHLEGIRSQMGAYFMVDNLNHLKRSGRLSGAQALVGSLLKIKPILHFDNGEIVPFEKVRTETKALNRMLTLLDEDVNKGDVNEVVVIHANRRSGAEELKERILERHPNQHVRISYFGPVIGTHLGAGSLGVSWY
ncbi:DegV family protein [Shouchella shacheensis]|uniref:DegV family protein n=1 Tax=Shouchella shacheensis TaxID=1649580 RepID=UPI00073FD3D5|nr:DegV family protein [Shouchella shacheensis]